MLTSNQLCTPHHKYLRYLRGISLSNGFKSEMFPFDGTFQSLPIPSLEDKSIHFFFFTPFFHRPFPFPRFFHPHRWVPLRTFTPRWSFTLAAYQEDFINPFISSISRMTFQQFNVKISLFSFSSENFVAFHKISNRFHPSHQNNYLQRKKSKNII